MPDTTNPIGFTDANELREKNRATVEKYMNRADLVRVGRAMYDANQFRRMAPANSLS